MLSPPTSCSGSDSCLTSSSDTHPVTKICEFPYSFHLITQRFFLLHCLSNIPFTFSACNISLQLWSHHFHSSTSSMDPLTTLYALSRVNLYPQAVKLTLVDFSLVKPSSVIPPLAIAVVFSRLTFMPLLSMASFHFVGVYYVATRLMRILPPSLIMDSARFRTLVSLNKTATRLMRILPPSLIMDATRFRTLASLNKTAISLRRILQPSLIMDATRFRTLVSLN